ncbi:MAG TPA: hypothetical protein VFW19_16310 [Allosphingosinicella sp.]|nr:hypothetical protein [Allosphingosinicella sp.]
MPSSFLNIEKTGPPDTREDAAVDEAHARAEAFCRWVGKDGQVRPAAPAAEAEEMLARARPVALADRSGLDPEIVEKADARLILDRHEAGERSAIAQLEAQIFPKIGRADGHHGESGREIGRIPIPMRLGPGDQRVDLAYIVLGSRDDLHRSLLKRIGFHWKLAADSLSLAGRHREGISMEHHPNPYIEFRKHFLRPLEKRENRFNDWLAVHITNLVGTMWCAYAFAILALISLPAAILAGTAALIGWIAQTFLQLVLLSIIMVGQKVAAVKSDRQLEQTYTDAEELLKISDEIHRLLKQNTDLTQDIQLVLQKSAKG